METKNKLGIALTKCFFCGRDKEIIMNTRLTEPLAKKVEEMNGMVIDKEPCNECKKYMKQGIILISVKDGEQGDNPYRTGGFVVIKEEAAERMFNKEAYIQIAQTRVAFIEDSIWDKLGLPRGEI